MIQEFTTIEIYIMLIILGLLFMLLKKFEQNVQRRLSLFNKDIK
jgi:hypothetical protein